VALLFVLGAGLVLLIGSRIKRPEPVRLSDGTLVRFHSVTRGTNHVARLGRLHQHILRFAPKRMVPAKWMKGFTVEARGTPTNAVLVWLHLSNARSDLHYSVTDTTGVGAYRSQFTTIPRWDDALYPLTLEQWPKTAPKIGITFYGENARETLGSILIDNPQRSTRSATGQFSARSLPARERNNELELALLTLEVMPGGKTFSHRVGKVWAARATFNIFENGMTNQDWLVQSLYLSDAGGNWRRATGPREWKTNEFEILFDPLFLTEGAWKLEVHLVRAANFPPNETVTFSGVPMPLQNEHKDAVFHTNLLGHRVTLHSMKVAKATRRNQPGTHSMGSPGFVIELDTPGEGLVPRIAGIWNERGEEIPIPAHGSGEGYSIMRFSVPKGSTPPETLRVAVTVQPKRTFTFFASPRVLH
jgi:hypothetical protein